ncbi:MAG TPA: hypothetical protein VJP80_04525 [Candidatus Saccharimonadales bacterium]|nr:hypothetical protein [Candidatus Saccharimonadales bacterium]
MTDLPHENNYLPIEPGPWEAWSEPDIPKAEIDSFVAHAEAPGSHVRTSLGQIVRTGQAYLTALEAEQLTMWYGPADLPPHVPAHQALGMTPNRIALMGVERLSFIRMTEPEFAGRSHMTPFVAIGDMPTAQEMTTPSTLHGLREQTVAQQARTPIGLGVVVLGHDHLAVGLADPYKRQLLSVPLSIDEIIGRATDSSWVTPPTQTPLILRVNTQYL